MKVFSVVGARPEFVQVAVLSRALRRDHAEILVHTGQHYDDRMSDRFFSELNIPDPDYHLGVGPGEPNVQTGIMLGRLAETMRATDPDLVIVRGDTNSTLAGSLAAKSLLLPLVHIEGGMRSYDRTMPEEINRIVSDHISDVALVTDEAARARLEREGVRQNVHVCGDVMYDVFLQARERATAQLASQLRAYARAPYALLTLHRAENTDDAERLRSILAGFANAPQPVLFPIHPRTASRLAAFGIDLPPEIVPLPPLGYLDIVGLECGATTIFTDSGGVQREAFFAGVPCVTLRDATEWTNTVDAGWNRLVGSSSAEIARALREPPARPATHPQLFGAGDAAERIVRALETDATREIVRVARAHRLARGYAASAEAIEPRAASGAVSR